MEAFITAFFVAIGICTALLIAIGFVFLRLFVFKILCKIHAEIVAEKIDEVLEMRGIGTTPAESEE